MADIEQTLIIVKPDGVQRGLVGEIVGRLERRGLKIVAMQMQQVSRETAEKHYAEHEGKPFFAGLVDYITSAPVVVMVLEGPQAVAAARSTIGSTKPVEATPGTIRGDWADGRSQPDPRLGQPGERQAGDRDLLRRLARHSTTRATSTAGSSNSRRFT